MEIRVLRYFLTVAREQNMTRAAEHLHVTQPTLSKQLKQLEEENKFLKEDIKEWKSLKEEADEKIHRIKNSFIEQKDNLQMDLKQEEDKNKEYLDIIEKIKKGNWVILRNQDEIDIVQDKINRINQVYNEIQEMIREHEDFTGICTDGISDIMFCKYQKAIKEEEYALSLGFKVLGLLDVDEILNEKESLENSFNKEIEAIETLKY